MDAPAGAVTAAVVVSGNPCGRGRRGVEDGEGLLPVPEQVLGRGGLGQDREVAEQNGALALFPGVLKRALDPIALGRTEAAVPLLGIGRAGSLEAREFLPPRLVSNTHLHAIQDQEAPAPHAEVVAAGGNAQPFVQQWARERQIVIPEGVIARPWQAVEQRQNAVQVPDAAIDDVAELRGEGRALAGQRFGAAGELGRRTAILAPARRVLIGVLDVGHDGEGELRRLRPSGEHGCESEERGAGSRRPSRKGLACDVGARRSRHRAHFTGTLSPCHGKA